MKILIASDIHGSMFYLNKLLARVKAEKADKILLLGDILYHGPRNDLPQGYEPKAVAKALNEISDKIICVRGNCDTEVDQMVLDFPILADYCILEAAGKTIFATHGHKYNPENLPSRAFCDILLNGHTHIPAAEKLNGFTYINSGSVAIPKENSEHSYLILDDSGFTFKNLEGKTYNTYKF